MSKLHLIYPLELAWLTLIPCSITGTELRVNVSNNIACRLGDKARTIVVEAASNVEIPNFRHNAGNIIFEVPAAYCV